MTPDGAQTAMRPDTRRVVAPVTPIAMCAAVQLLCGAAGTPARLVLSGAPHYSLTVTLRTEADLRAWHAQVATMDGREDSQPQLVRARLCRSRLTWLGWVIHLQHLAEVDRLAAVAP